MKPYPKYKDSGVEWLRKLPIHWDSLKMKHVCRFEKGWGLSKSQLDDNGKYFCVLYGELFTIYKGANKINEVLSKTNAQEGDISKGNEVLIPGSTTTTGIDLANAKALFESNVLLGGDIIILRPLKKTYLQEFISYFITYVNNIEFAKYAKGITIIHIYGSSIREMPVFHPPVQEQRTIVSFLNKKTKFIDDLIDKKKRQIELLKEQRTAIINHAVTKGLNPDVKMKDSGIEWLGEIPEHWELKPLKFIGKIVLGKMLTNEDKGGYFQKPYLRAQNITWEKVDTNDVKKMWFSENELYQYRLKKNDLLVSEGGEVGRTAIWKNELDECYIQNSVHKVSLNPNNNPYYYLYHCQIYGKKGYFDSIVNRVSIAHLTREKLKDIKFLSPPSVEQNSITNNIIKKTSEIDGLIKKYENSIERLKEYRTTLISDAVTGKIDLRDEVPQ